MIRQKIILICLSASFMFNSAMLPACSDYYLEWRKITLADDQPAQDGYFGVSEAVARLKSALKVEGKLPVNWPHKLKLVFAGWGDNEKPANEQQFEDIATAFRVFFPDKMIDINAKNLVDSPDFGKLAGALPANSPDYAVSFIVKSCSQQWKSFLSRDFSSMFKLRIVLQEKVEVECKLVDKEGKLVFFETFAVRPSQLFDFNYENSGVVDINSERYSSDLIMNVIADKLPPIIPAVGN